MPLTKLDIAQGEGFHGYPQMVTNDRFLYWAKGGQPDTTGMYVASLKAPAARQLVLKTQANALYTSANDGKDYLLWTRGGTLLAQEVDAASLTLLGEAHTVLDSVATSFITGEILASASTQGELLVSSANVVSQLTWFGQTGTSLGTLGDPAEYTTFRLSPDGRRVVADRERADGADLWLLDGDRGGIASRFTSRPSYSGYAVWSPDGQTIAFGTDSPENLFQKAVSGAAGSERRLFQAPNQQLPMDWSRDGRVLLFYDLAPATGRDLAVLPLASDGSQPQPYLRTPFSEWWGRFIPEVNPRWVAYQSDESGRNEVYIDAFPTPHARTQISTTGGQYPVWHPNGRELFYLSPDFKLMAVSLTIGADAVVAGTPHELFALPAVDTGRSPYDVSPDGQRFLVRATPTGTTQSLTMVLNWPATLKR
jgi:dipeptidyl aminopeptidase/acylaminoacyl peptidase